MTANQKDKAWYKQWFNTPYYHILYQHRNDTEAQVFIDHILKATFLEEQGHFLDLACGRGRHAIYLSKKGHKVTGLDLSPENIEFARQFENENLHFQQGDMREPYGNDLYHCVLNLFTSFGYFNSKEESLRACQQVKRALVTDGYFWLDFMNVHKVALGLVSQEIIETQGLRFAIERKIEKGQVVKEISFTAKGQSHRYQERVQLLTLADFKALFKQAGLTLEACYGSYTLEAFDKNSSERLILKARA